MGIRSHADRIVDGLFAFGSVLSTVIMQANKERRGEPARSGPAEDDSDEENAYGDFGEAELWGTASLLSRPQDGAEALFWRTGDERVVIATKDRRWQSEHTLEKGDVVLRWCGDINPPSIGMGGGGGGDGPRPPTRT